MEVNGQVCHATLSLIDAGMLTFRAAPRTLLNLSPPAGTTLNPSSASPVWLATGDFRRRRRTRSRSVQMVPALSVSPNAIRLIVTNREGVTENFPMTRNN